MATLNLFPARVAIGNVDVDGIVRPVMMTPEFFRALSDLLTRVGGPNGTDSGDIEETAEEALRNTLDLQVTQSIEAGAAIAEAKKAIQDMQCQLLESVAAVGELAKHIEWLEMQVGGVQPAPTNWERPGPIGALTPNSGLFTTLNTNGNAIIGNAIANARCRVNGPNSGANGGATFEALNGGVTVIAMGNKSVLLGGAYDATPLVYANAALEFFTNIKVPGGANAMITSTSPFNNGAAAAVGTLNNAPAAGNPTKWIALNDNGTTRYVPSW